MTNRFLKTEAIVIKKKNDHETDQIITFFTQKYGKLNARARGVRKLSSKRAANLDLFNHVMIFLYCKEGWYTLTEIKIINSFSQIKKDLTKIALAFQTIELIDRMLAFEQVHPDTFSKTTSLLSHLEESFNFKLDSLLIFKQELLRDLGFGIPDKSEWPDIDQYLESIINRHLILPHFLTP